MTPALLVLAAAIGAGLGLRARRWLERRSYRYADEQDIRPHGHGWVPVAAAVGLPLMALTGLAVGAGGGRDPGAGGVVLAVGLAVVGLVMVLLAAIDLDVQRLPDRLTLPLVPATAAVLALASVLRGEHTDLVRSLLAGTALLVVFLVLVVLGGQRGLGLGDAKLAPTLGLLLGYLGWSQVFLATMFAFVAAAAVGVVLIALRRADRHSSVAFGPYLLGATVLVLALPGLASLTG